MTDCVLRGRLVLEDSVVDDGIIEIDGSTITRICPVSNYDAALPEASDSTFLPGLVDVHCHGGGGESFPNAETAEAALVAVMEHRRHGTTSLVASCVTASADVLRRRAATLAQLANDSEIAGIHFEGPFVSHERCGAQDPTYIIDPDPSLTLTLLKDCQGHALSMTLAPEKPGAYGPGSVAEALIDGGALPSWGHTDSNSVMARQALEYSRERFAEVKTKRGPRATITHLFNGMRPLHHRDTGPVAEFLSDAARGGAVVELICDSIHVDPTLVRDVYEMVGREHVVFVTDAMAAAGMPDGEYTLGPQDVVVRDGVARLAQGNAIAGGTAHLLDCVRVAVTRGGIPLVDAVYMASAQGATILGDDTIGSLAAGKKADVVEVDAQLNVHRVWRRGTVVA
ncbi:amidohydrolase family protein [Schaalia meyeri]|uniref:Amidohydrolase family protein n=1 Tax=Schaalia meyeri TaxID=52773 RepID=A0AAP9Y7J3_9ACTO|nr:amidohydrolase family protein [Schaalia meyeri]QQC44267.1 amidohydrolase family protein [Schaalia meyeri]SDR65324.1 N-acetylglucosamine-6-phosphate deacetylase [Schaalia meyeri]SDR65342.1 N-acetylglucosamine-6-phosphate deacetylase [Schaalia meyeri]SDR80201.1 N-acetylglucosamine-6-phosphate deacetylase [Schaalia meyeri]